MHSNLSEYMELHNLFFIDRRRLLKICISNFSSICFSSSRNWSSLEKCCHFFSWKKLWSFVKEEKKVWKKFHENRQQTKNVKTNAIIWFESCSTVVFWISCLAAILIRKSTKKFGCPIFLFCFFGNFTI